MFDSVIVHRIVFVDIWWSLCSRNFMTVAGTMCCQEQFKVTAHKLEIGKTVRGTTDLLCFKCPRSHILGHSVLNFWICYTHIAVKRCYFWLFDHISLGCWDLEFVWFWIKRPSYLPLGHIAKRLWVHQRFSVRGQKGVTRLDKPILYFGALHFWKNLSHLKGFFTSCQMRWLKFLPQ